MEKWLLRDSDAFVTLTEKAREILFPESKETGFDKRKRPVEVIPCCVDLERFKKSPPKIREEMRKNLNIENRLVIGYVGSFGGFYLTEETADFLGTAKAKNSDVFALILTQTAPQIIQSLLEARGFSDNDFLILKILPSEIPIYLAAADFAVSLIIPSFSKKASSPTKIAEYLAAGLPFVSNAEIGDLDELIAREKIGVVPQALNKEAYSEAFDKMCELIKDRHLAEHCKKVAENEFDLEKVGGKKYDKLYRRLV